MPHWLLITIAVFFWLFALKQVRMTFIYLGLVPHPFIPRGFHLAKIAILSAINFTIYGFIVFLISWPKMLTYFFGAIVCMTVVDGILGLVGLGMFGDMIESQIHLKSQATYLTSKIAVFDLITWLCFYFFGF
jgi:hypothetical protein